MPFWTILGFRFEKLVLVPHAATEIAFVGFRAAALGTATWPDVPFSWTARSVSPVSSPETPSVKPPEYVPVFAPLLSAAVVPDVSPSRQWATGDIEAMSCR